MNTVDKFANEIAQRLANAIVEGSNYKILHEEAQEKLAGMHSQLTQVQAQLERINSVLDADDALKELLDEVAEKLEAEKLEKEK